MSRRLFLPAFAFLLCLASLPEARAGELPGAYAPWNDVDLAGIATLNGNATFSMARNEMSVIVTPGGVLQSFGSVIELHGAITADVQADASGQFDLPLPLVVIPLPAMPVSPTLGILPLVGITGRIKGSIEAGAHFSFSQQIKNTISFQFDKNGIQANLLDTPQREDHVAAPLVTGNTHCDLELSIVAGGSFQILYNLFPIGGPTIVAELTVGGEVDPFADPWFEIDGRFALTVSFMGPGFNLFPTPLVDLPFDIYDAGGPLPLELPDPQRWSRVLDLGGDQEVTSIFPVADGLLVTGHAAGVGNRAYLAKVNDDGTMAWEKRAQALPFSSFRPLSVFSASNGDIVLGGQTLTSGGARVERLDSAGNPLWNRILVNPPGTLFQIRSLAPSSGGGAYFAGGVGYLVGSLTRPVVGEIDSTGAILWAKQFDPGTASETGSFVHVVATADSGVLCVGRMDYQDFPYPATTIDYPNLFALKLDAQHAVQFATVVGTKLWDEAFTACEGEDGTLVIGGQTTSWVAPNIHAAVLVGLDPAGVLKWTRTYAGESVAGSSGDTPYDAIDSIAPVAGGYLVTGHTGLPNQVRDAWIFGVDWDGVTTFFKSFRSDQRDELSRVISLGEEGLFACGTTRALDPSLPNPWGDFWLARTQFDAHLEFDPQFGFDCRNDAHDWAPGHSFTQHSMPGSVVDFPLTTTTGACVYDPIATGVTVITQ